MTKNSGWKELDTYRRSTVDAARGRRVARRGPKQGIPRADAGVVRRVLPRDLISLASDRVA